MFISQRDFSRDDPQEALTSAEIGAKFLDNAARARPTR